MARPCKSVKLQSGDMTKAEYKARLENEEKLRGNTDKIIAPDYLNEHQTQLFDYLAKELKSILGNVDIYILSTCCIAIDRLQTIESVINENSELLFDKVLLSTKDKYTKDLFRTCSELSLSPSSRSKLANLNLKEQQEEDDPLLALLRGDFN